MTFPTKAEARTFLRQMPQTTAIVAPTTHGHWLITTPEVLGQPVRTCPICQESFQEFGCNARPVADGQCCAYCDDHVVTPTRIELHYLKELVRPKGDS